MEKLGILMLSDSFYPVRGGREMVIDKLMTEFMGKIDAKLICPRFKKHKSFDDNNLPYMVERCDSINITKNEVLSVVKRKQKKQIEADIVSGKYKILHVQTKYGLMKYALKLKKKYGVSVLTSVHTNYQAVYKKTLRVPFLYWFAVKRIKKILNRVDKITTVSNFMKGELEKLGVRVPIEVIPNGNNFANAYVGDDDIKKINDLYGWQDDENILIFIGRLCKAKSIEVILKSLQYLKSAYKMVFIGGGETEEYSRIAKSLNVAKNCHFVGQINDANILRAVCARASLQVFPSVTETFGMTIPECGAVGTPSIVTENMATAEFIKDGFNGYITDGSPEVIGRKIDEVLSDKANLKIVSMNAKKTMCLTWSDIAERYISLYKSMVAC